MKILLLSTGGTIGSTARDGFIRPEANIAEPLTSGYDKEITFISEEIYNILSENSSISYLQLLIQKLTDVQNTDADAIIVTHGTDTLQYSAAAAGYALGLCCKPIVFVSANRPLENPMSNGTANFRTAVEFICSCPTAAGVYVSYTNTADTPKIHRATRLVPHLPFSDDVFSIYNSYIYEYKNNSFIKNPSFSEEADEAEPFGIPGNNDCRILTITPAPVTDYPQLCTDINAVFINSYHSGTLPTSVPEFVQFCKNAANLNIPVFMAGCTTGLQYESTAQFKELNICPVPYISPCAALIKLCFCIKSDIPHDILYKSIGGDIYVP